MIDEARHPLNNPPPYHTNLPTATKADRELLNARGLLQNFFAGVALEVANFGFCVVNVNLAVGLLSSANLPPVTRDFQEEALRYGLTAVIVSERRKVVFRRFHTPDNEHAENFLRADGGVLCEVCGFELREHPPDALFNWIRVRCDGRRVKL